MNHLEAYQEHKAPLSKAQKRATQKANRGRPRDEDAPRTESGRISRAKEPADRLALTIRARNAGITMKEAKDQKAESFIGILSIRGVHNGGISLGQYDALVLFRDLQQDHSKACDTPGLSLGKGEGGTYDPEAHVRWVSRVKEHYDRAKRAIGHEQEGNRIDNLWGALDACVRQDLRMWHLVPALRIVANCLSRHFKAAPLDRPSPSG